MNENEKLNLTLMEVDLLIIAAGSKQEQYRVQEIRRGVREYGRIVGKLRKESNRLRRERRNK